MLSLIILYFEFSLALSLCESRMFPKSRYTYRSMRSNYYFSLWRDFLTNPFRVCCHTVSSISKNFHGSDLRFHEPCFRNKREKSDFYSLQGFEKIYEPAEAINKLRYEWNIKTSSGKRFVKSWIVTIARSPVRIIHDFYTYHNYVYA